MDGDAGVLHPLVHLRDSSPLFLTHLPVRLEWQFIPHLRVVVRICCEGPLFDRLDGLNEESAEIDGHRGCVCGGVVHCEGVGEAEENRSIKEPL